MNTKSDSIIRISFETEYLSRVEASDHCFWVISA